MTPAELASALETARAALESPDDFAEDYLEMARALVEATAQLEAARGWNVRMRRICTAARKWAAQPAHRRMGFEPELIAAVNEAVAREDSKPIAAQLADARFTLRWWQGRVSELEAKADAKPEP